MNQNATGIVMALAITTSACFQASAATDERPDLINSIATGLTTQAQWASPNSSGYSIDERLRHYGVAGTAIAIIRNGAVYWSGGFGVREAGTDKSVDGDTVFSAGSVSKVVNAALILRLVADGQLDLDQDINRYLTKWTIPASMFGDATVTLRQILSHTAGFNVHGFADFQPGQTLPSLLDTLNGRSPARHGRIKLIEEPGTVMDYSGGGIQVSQLIVEEVTGSPYATAAQHYVFEPLGMSRSTFINPLPTSHGNIAHAHDRAGNATAQPRGYEAMPEQAASGLWVSSDDLARLVIALMGQGENASFLPEEFRRDMMTRQPNSWHGLGPRINGEGDFHVFHHGGANDSYRAWMQGHLATGDGLVILTNGTNGQRFYAELIRSVEEALSWDIRSTTHFARPDLDN